MKVPAQDLKAAFAITDEVEANPLLEASLLLRVTEDADTLHLALTGELWSEAQCSGLGLSKWTAYVDRRALKAFLAGVTDAEVEIFYKNKQVLFKAGSRLEMASSAGPNGYESWTPDRVINLPDAARKIFKLSAPYLNSNVDRAEASAVCLKQGYGVIATDTVSMLGFFGSAPTEDLLIPARVAKALGESGALAIGDRGVGAAYDHGYLYEPLSSALKDYPFPMSKKSLEAARQAETLAKAKVSELRDAVNAGKEFLLDKTDLGLLVSEDEALVLTIPMSTGAYRRRVAAEVLSPLAETRWSVKPPLAWLEWATAIDAEGEIEVARIEGALALRFRYGKRSSILLTSDL